MKLIICLCLLVFSNLAFALIDTVAIFAVDASVLRRRDTVVYYRVPGDGRFIISISNPDTSADGMFYIQVYDSATGNCIASNSFFTTGTIPLGPGGHVFYAGNPSDGLAYPRYEMSLTSQRSPTPPAPGTVLRINLGYPTGMLAGPQFGTEHTGMDTMFLLFEDVPLSEDTIGAIFLDSLISPPHSHRIHNYTFTAVCGIKLIARVTAWGDHGGGNCFYIDSLGCGGIYTGSPCACEYYSFIIPSGPGPHLLSITQEDDAWGDNTGTRAVMLYLVQLYPEADAGDDVTICAGDSVELGGTPTADRGTPPYSYFWTPPVGLSDPTAANPIASPDTTTEYILTIVDAAACTDEDTVVVTVNYPVIDSVWFWEETDCNDSNIVHICYTLSNCGANIRVWMSADSGETWMPAGSSWFATLLDTVGNIGEKVPPGTHCFEWVMSKDLPGVEDIGFEVRAIIEYTAGYAQLYYEDWNDSGITDDGWCMFDTSMWRYWWDSTLVSGCCDGTPAFRLSRTVTWGSWTEKDGFSYTFSPPLSGVDSISFDFCYGYLGGSDSACFDAFVASVSLVFTDGKEVEYHMGGFYVDGDPTSPTYGHFLPYNPDTTDSFLSINTAGMGGSYARDSCYHINRCVSEDAGWFTTAPLEEIRLTFRHGRRIVGTGLCTASGYVEFDNIRLTHSSTTIVDTAFYIGPLDSRTPRVSISCPESAVFFGDTAHLSWHVEDMFWANDPCTVRINMCGTESVIVVADTALDFVAPVDLPCDSAVVYLSARDSFCNWGHDTCTIRFAGYISLYFGDTIASACRTTVVPLYVDSSDCMLDMLIVTFSVDTTVVYPTRFVPTVTPAPDSFAMSRSGERWNLEFYWSTRTRINTGVVGFLHVRANCAVSAGYYSIIDIEDVHAHLADAYWRDGTVLIDYNVSPWLVTLHIDDLTSEAHTEVTFGANYGSTDGYDPWIDLLHLAPPPGVIDAWFDIDDPSHPAVRKLYRDVRDMVVPDEWHLVISHPSSVRVHWRHAALGEGFYTINGFFDMRSDTQYFAAPFETLTITWDLQRLCLDTVRMYSGWNLISIPLRCPRPYADFIFGRRFYGPYHYDPISKTFFIPNFVGMGRGYYVYSARDTILVISGVRFPRYKSDIFAGWNLLGCPSFAVDTASVGVVGTWILGIFELDSTGSYVVPDSLRPGKGYWFLVPNDGKIYVPR